MTAFNALLSNGEILLSMDTQVSRYDEKGILVPSYFTQKFEYMPFCKTIVTGTGNYDVINHVFNDVRRMLVKEIDTLADIVADGLAKLDYSEFQLDKSTATIYLLGYTASNETKAYAFRSTQGFAKTVVAKENQEQLFIKPNLFDVEGFKTEIDNALELDDISEQFVELMKIEKKYDELTDNPVGIGGENIVIAVSNEADNATILKLDVFDDYQEKYQMALDYIHNNL